MIRHNELVLNGKGTSCFPFKVLVEDRPSIQV
ncbi:TPA: phage tail protein, partial [Streptococcus agalactiae]|nr:phage tail protein [Streptococcus agalactiae]